MFFRLLNSIVRRRRVVGWITFVFFAAGLAYVLASGSVYEARTLLLPPVEEGSQGILSAWMAKLNLPSVVSPASAGSTSAAILGDIMQSRRLGEMIVDTLDLRGHYRTKSMDEAIEELRGKTKISITETGLIQLAVRDRDPAYAASIAAAYIAGLDSLNRMLQYTRADQTRRFIADQIEAYRAELQRVRTDIAAFQGTNNIIDFDEQVRGAIEVAADLKVRTVLAGIDRDLLTEYAQGNSAELRRKNAEYDNLTLQLKRLLEGDGGGSVFVPLKSLPALAQRYAAMQRDLEVNERVYSYLLERYEEAGIDKARTTPVVQVVDAPSVPEKPSGMPLPLIVLIVTAVGALWGMAVVAWWSWASMRSKSQDEERALAELRSTMRRDLDAIRARFRL